MIVMTADNKFKPIRSNPSRPE